MRTGKLVWTFHSVPEKGEFGADTWPEAALASGGGVHNWSELTVDEARGIAYIPFGTARFDFYGGNRIGNNLFGNSIVALDARTGKRLWHFQAVHHDLWDYDFPQAPKILTVRNNGRNVDILAQATKQGYLYVFDRVTGKPLWPIEEKPVPQSDVPGEKTSPTQPIPTLPPPFARQSFTEKDINPYLTAEEQAGLAREPEEVAQRRRVHAAEHAGLDRDARAQRRRELGQLGDQPGEGHLLHRLEGTADAAGDRAARHADRTRRTWRRRRPGGAGARVRADRKAPRRGGSAAGSPRSTTAGHSQARRQGFVAYNSPYDFLNNYANGMSAIGPPWSQLTAYDLNTGKDHVAGAARRDAGPAGRQDRSRQLRAARRRHGDGRRPALRRHVI